MRLGRSALDHCTVHLTVEQRGENGRPTTTSGTGIVIRQAKPGARDGLILTCLHVLQEGGREATRIQARQHDGAPFECEVEPVFVDAADDWAIVAFKDQPGKNPPEIPKVQRAERSPPRPGFEVGAEASPNLFLVDFVGADPRLRYQSALAYEPELVHGRAPKRPGPGPADVLAYRYFVGSEPGSSGAALVNPRGEVLGLHGSSEPYGALRLGRAVCIERILTRLRRQGIPTDFDAVPGRPTLLPPMVAQDVGGGTPSQGADEASREEDGQGARWKGVLAGIAAAVLGIGAIFVVYDRPPAVDFYNDLLGCWRTEDAAEHAAWRHGLHLSGTSCDPRHMRHAVTSLILSCSCLLACASTPPVAPGPSVRLRPVSDAFVDTFGFADRAPIRATMPFNISDDRFAVAMRVDHFGPIVAASETRDGKWTKDELFAAFYDNQEAYNRDPARNRTRVYGTVVERDEGGKTIATCTIRYERLPMNVYTYESMAKLLPAGDAVGDPRALEALFVRGEASGVFYTEIELPAPGAPLHFWNASAEGRVRAFRFTAVGVGELTGRGGFPAGPGQVVVDEVEDDGVETTRIEVTPLTPAVR